MSQPYYQDASVTVFHGDCLDVLRGLPDNSVDAVVTDPPAGISFMGRTWDHHKGGREQWSAWLAEVMREAYRIAKPGAHALVWAIPRTSHWTACGLEGAGWEIRDRLVHLFGTGFPKSLDVSKAIDRARDDRADILQVTSWLKAQAAARGFTRAEVDQHMGTSDMAGWWLTDLPHRCQCPTWEQWDILKRFMGLPDDMDAEVWRLNGRKSTPGEAWELREVLGEQMGYKAHYGGQEPASRAFDITAPATEAAKQWQGWGTALKPAAEDWWLARKPLQGTVAANVTAWGTGALNIDGCRIGDDTSRGDRYNGKPPGGAGFIDHDMQHSATWQVTPGRWPANVVLDEAAAQELDQQSGELTSGANPTRRSSDKFRDAYGDFKGQEECIPARGADSGGASRFMYTAKAGSDERIIHNGTAHPTVKPLALMRWLVRLVTPPGGVILEPFAGSGTTVEAAILERFRCIAIEREADYLPHITQRIHRRRDPLAYLSQGGHDMGLFEEPEGARVVPDGGNGREGEASAERRYTDRGGTNFAPKPERRRRD